MKMRYRLAFIVVLSLVACSGKEPVATTAGLTTTTISVTATTAPEPSFDAGELALVVTAYFESWTRSDWSTMRSLASGPALRYARWAELQEELGLVGAREFSVARGPEAARVAGSGLVVVDGEWVAGFQSLGSPPSSFAVTEPALREGPNGWLLEDFVRDGMSVGSMIGETHEAVSPTTGIDVTGMAFRSPIGVEAGGALNLFVVVTFDNRSERQLEARWDLATFTPADGDPEHIASGFIVTDGIVTGGVSSEMVWFQALSDTGGGGVVTFMLLDENSFSWPVELVVPAFER